MGYAIYIYIIESDIGTTWLISIPLALISDMGYTIYIFMLLNLIFEPRGKFTRSNELPYV